MESDARKSSKEDFIQRDLVTYFITKKKEKSWGCNSYTFGLKTMGSVGTLDYNSLEALTLPTRARAMDNFRQTAMKNS